MQHNLNIRALQLPKYHIRRRMLNALQRGLSFTGFGSAYVRAKDVNGAMILMYHGITDEKDVHWIDPRYSVPRSMFERQMRFLARNRNVISMTELLSIIASGNSAPPGSVVITFDDGYRSMFTKAAPILERYHLPATLYLATGYVTRVEPQWIDRLYSMFSARSQQIIEIPGREGRSFDLTKPWQAREAYFALADQLLPVSRQCREQLLNEVKEQLLPDRPPPPLTLSWDEIRVMRRLYSGIEIGVHTRDHIDLTSCQPDEAIEQVAMSVDDVQRELSLTPQHFAYPYGRSNSEARRAVSLANLHSAVLAYPPRLVRSDADPYTLPRVAAPASMSLFPFYTSGAYPQASLAVFGYA